MERNAEEQYVRAAHLGRNRMVLRKIMKTLELNVVSAYPAW